MPLRSYRIEWGTSIAFPMATGVIALVLCNDYAPFSVWHSGIGVAWSANKADGISVSLDGDTIILSVPHNATWCVIAVNG